MRKSSENWKRLEPALTPLCRRKWTSEWAMIREMLTLPTPEPIWQWAAREIDFSRCANYDTPIKGVYDPEYMPFWKPVQDWFRDDAVREIVVLKNSRCGYSENACLIPMRWIMAQAPARTMYLTGDQTSGERFYKERIRRGNRLSPEVAKAWSGAQVTEHEARLRGMDFRLSWPRSKLAFKQDGWEVIFCDEVDTWPEFAADMARKRCDTYPFHKIVFGSSIDPARAGGIAASPILALFAETDRREWMMEDPKTGRRFRFEFGKADGASGIKWPEDAKDAEGEWDLMRVRNEAWYQTPDGTRISEAERVAVMRTGQWQPTAVGYPGRVGVRVVQPMVPFASGSFGNLAAEFLSAKRRGNVALATYFAEYWACGYEQESDEVEAAELDNRSQRYKRGEKFYGPDVLPGDTTDEKPNVVLTLLTFDVHRDWLQWVVRQWKEPGHSALVDWGEASGTAEIDQLAERHGVYAVLFDNHYEHRRMEMLDYAAESKSIPLLGSDNIAIPYQLTQVDPREGKRGHGAATVNQYTWSTNEFRMRLIMAMRGETAYRWSVYKGIESDYVKQVTSTELKAGKWQTKPKQTQDHLFDCEVMQFVAAGIAGVCR